MKISARSIAWRDSTSHRTFKSLSIMTSTLHHSSGKYKNKDVNLVTYIVALLTFEHKPNNTSTNSRPPWFLLVPVSYPNNLQCTWENMKSTPSYPLAKLIHRRNLYIPQIFYLVHWTKDRINNWFVELSLQVKEAMNHKSSYIWSDGLTQ